MLKIMKSARTAQVAVWADQHTALLCAVLLLLLSMEAFCLFYWAPHVDEAGRLLGRILHYCHLL